jgi:hypothetical protein
MSISIGIIYYHENPGSCFFDSKDNIPWREEDRYFSIKLIEHEQVRGMYYLAYSDNGFLTSKTLMRLASVVDEDGNPWCLPDVDSDSGWADRLKKIGNTYEDFQRVNRSINSYIEEHTIVTGRIFEFVPKKDSIKTPDI